MDLRVSGGGSAIGAYFADEILITKNGDTWNLEFNFEVLLHLLLIKAEACIDTQAGNIISVYYAGEIPARAIETGRGRCALHKAHFFEGFRVHSLPDGP